MTLRDNLLNRIKQFGGHELFNKELSNASNYSTEEYRKYYDIIIVHFNITHLNTEFDSMKYCIKNADLFYQMLTAFDLDYLKRESEVLKFTIELIEFQLDYTSNIKVLAS